MDWKDKLNALKSEVPHIEEEEVKMEPQEKTVVKKEMLRVELDKRKGKPATIISEFQGTDEELKDLTKTLKEKCASGGSQRDGEILIQGDFRVKIAEILLQMGYKVKKINFK